MLTTYIISALIGSFSFSIVTSILIVFGIEQMGEDPGAPAIMLVGFIFICGILSVVTWAIMDIMKTKFQKEFPAKVSAGIFLFMYLPFHIIGLFFTDGQYDFLAIPTTIMLFLSYVPFFHLVAQSLTNLDKLFRKRKKAA